ncbi:cell wall-associated hydrolase, invasion-associated protein [Desulfosporosinus acidiphilus SJ4]|uniref:Cell wall-associated hydrolase, invasion-associated protein n=2 Tax=Desulfosporosinus TaxID=79206 RepID=I4D5V4_DESAJ|nr:cell wall-associated hydrolase, invasion-associated protein [Desulfosporosinus acidiphilus SJ4]
MKRILSSKFLVPVISSILLISFITIAPTPISKDQVVEAYIAPQLAPKITSQESLEKANPTSIPTPQTPEKNPNMSSESGSNSSSVPTSSKPASVPPQPSRSSNFVTTGSAPRKSSGTTATSSLASAIIATGKNYIGVKYVYGGTSPSGFDCSGYVQYVFAQHGISLPRVSRDQYHAGSPVAYSQLEPGDLVFFSLAHDGIVDHEGIYIGNNQFLNAASSKGVTIYTLGPYWKSAYVGARRVC